MTIAIYQPTRGAHRMHRKTITRRLWQWLTGETAADIPAKHPGATEITAVIDPIVVTDPLDPRWVEPPGEQVQPFIGEWVEAQYHAEHGRPLESGWNHNWNDFTGTWKAITVADEDDYEMEGDGELALPVGSQA